MKKSTWALISAALVATVADLSGEDAPATTAAPAADDKPRTRGKAAAAEEKRPEPAAGGLTIEDVRKVTDPLLKAKLGAEVKKVISTYGASLTDVPPDKYKDLIADLEVLSL